MIKKMAFVAQPTKNMAAMRTFYGETLGLAPSIDHQTWAEFKTPDGKTIALDTYSAQMPDAKPYLALESDDIEADMQRLVDGYRCEWAEVVRSPARRAWFHHFAASTDPDPSLEFVSERGQRRPADWPETAAASAGDLPAEEDWCWAPVGRVDDFPR